MVTQSKSMEVGSTREVPVRAIDLERLGIALTYINTDAAARRDAALRNARLIACMDDMHEALQAVHIDAVHLSGNEFAISRATVDKVAAALSKALGQSGGTK